MVRRGFSFFLALALGALGFAQQKGRIAPDDAQPNAEKLVTEIKWHDSLESVLADARKEKKLAFYMHMLGKINGDT
jgi:hypothetical protein